MAIDNNKPNLASPKTSQAAYRTAARTSNYTAAELTIWGMTMKIMREEGGIRGLYRGLVATAVGVAPYVGINFATYELLRGTGLQLTIINVSHLFRGIITPPGQSSVPRKVCPFELSKDQKE